MSLFKWSTPERRRADGILPIIPNEIYLHILELIAPSTSGCLTPEELTTFTNLSLVCRFFANVCLPRIFERVEFSGSVFPDDTPTYHLASYGSTLCTQITAKQPLALSLAERVRICHFTSWELQDTSSWAVGLFAKKYISAMSCMKNIHELKFLDCAVDAEHWSAIAGLGSLKELSFDSCHFLRGPGKGIQVKVPHLHVSKCIGHSQLIAAIDSQRLRILAMDFFFFHELDWLSLSTALTELRLHVISRGIYVSRYYMGRLRDILSKAPHSVASLRLSVDIQLVRDMTPDIVQSVLHDPAWKNLSSLHSLTLQVLPDDDVDIHHGPINGINFHQNHQIPTLKDSPFATGISHTEILRNLRDRHLTSGIQSVDVYGVVFHLVNGEWSEASSCGAT